MVALLVLLTIIGFLCVDYWIRRRRAEVVASEEALVSTPASFESVEYRAPAGVYFDPGHTWLFLEESGAAKVGLTDFAQAVIGKVDHIATLPVGEKVSKGDVLVKLYHGERTAEFRAPVDGVVGEINNELLQSGTLRGREPYTAGWLYKITPSDTFKLPGRMHLGAEAKAWLNREVRRLKVFLATIAPEHPVLGQTMQDGGLPSTGLIDHLGDLEWNRLHERFFG
jgi:glycine cleavage system H protein